MSAILPRYITLLLLFLISFSSQYDNNESHKFLEKNGIVPVDKNLSFESFDCGYRDCRSRVFIAHVNNGYIVAIKSVTAQGRLIPIIPIAHIKSNCYGGFRSHCILKAYNLNYFTKFCYKFFDLYDKYNEYFWKTRWSVFIYDFLHRDCPYTFLPAKILYRIFCFSFLYIGYFPVYHAQMIPSYILSYLFEFFLFQFGIINKNFVYFWTFPCFFNFVGVLFLFNGFTFEILHLSQISIHFFFSSEVRPSPTEIKPRELKWAVEYFMKKENGLLFQTSGLQKAFFALLLFLSIFFDGYLFALPFSFFMPVTQGETNK